MALEIKNEKGPLPQEAQGLSPRLLTTSVHTAQLR